MFNKKFLYSMILMFCLITMISMVSAVPPVQSTIVAEDGLEIEVPIVNYLQQDADYTFRFRVYNASNNAFLNKAEVNCSMGIVNKHGDYIFQKPDVDATGYKFAVVVSGGNFTELGSYHQGINCYHLETGVGGVKTQAFEVNGFGEQLDTAHSLKFNSAMLFIMILWLCSLFGIFYVDDYKGKFALYWICHVLFVVETFCMWQFNAGYTTTFMGMVGIWKILFYVSTIAMFPMVLLSIAWIFYIHTMNDTIKGFMDRGMDENVAIRRASK